MTPGALLFDVFGTLVDWRTGVIRELRALAEERAIELDAAAFADAWRGLYQPSMEQVRCGARPWTVLDRLHRESLVTLLARFAVTGLDEQRVDALNCAWHRLDPWPDVVDGLQRMKRDWIIAPHSNGNIALLTNMAKRAGLPWDVILGAEVVRAYKPLPESYLRAAAALGLAPEQCVMVAAHNEDLVAAAACGLRTAFVPRPTEHGPGQVSDLAPGPGVDYVAGDLGELARLLAR